MATAFSFKRDWRDTPHDVVRERIAECHCRPPGHPSPRYVLADPDEIQKGEWQCPH